MKGYIFLIVSILGEIFATTMLKYSSGFTLLIPSVGVILGYLFSFYFLSLCLKELPLSLAYAIWAGVGTALTALISVVLMGDILSFLKILGIILIIGGVIILSSMKNVEVLD